MQCTSNLCLWCRTSVRRTARSELLRFHCSVISPCLELTLQKNSFLTRFTPTLSHSCCIWTIMKTQFGRWYNCTRSIDNNNSYILCDSYWQPNRNVGWQLCSRTTDQQINWWMYLDILLHIQSRVMKLSLESCSCSFMIFWKGIYTGTVTDLEVIWSQVSDTKIKMPLKNLVHCRIVLLLCYNIDSPKWRHHVQQLSMFWVSAYHTAVNYLLVDISTLGTINMVV